jgi:GT2 family glycosyltransferase
MRASIIIVSYNSLRDLEQCLNSLLKSNTSDTEIIVVDNASQDGSTEMVQSRFPLALLICSPENVGFGAANNLGASQARGEYLAFLNPDTIVTQGWLPPLLEVLESDPKVGMATSRILLMSDPNRVNTCGNDVHLSGLALCRGLGQAASSPPSGKTELVAAISGAAFAIRRELFHANGGFDEAFFLYMEDTDLSLRIRLAGYQIACALDSTVYHDYELTFGSMKTFYQERNRYLMLLKCLRWRTLIILLPALILAEVVTWGFVLWRDRSNIRNKLLACNWILSNWRQIMARRSIAQGLRQQTRDGDLLRLTTARIDYAQTGSGWVVKLSALVFDPLFTLLRGLALTLVWW